MLGSLSGPTVRSLVIGLAVISVLSFGAGTLADSVDLAADSGVGPIEGDEQNVPDGEEVGSGIGDEDGGGEDIGIGDMRLTRCVDALNSAPGTAAYFGVAFIALYLTKRRFNTGTAMLAGFGVAPFVLAGYFLNTDCVDISGEPERGIFPTPDPGTQLFQLPDVSPVILAGVVGVVLIGAAVVILRATGEQAPVVDEEVPDEHEPDVRDLARAARAAADRLEKHNADVDNAVYRAWWEMTRLLDVPNPKSATPGEFAEAAVEVGMAREHVAELTTLFEEVRYGQRDPETREEHAIEVFRMIEQEYSGDMANPFNGEGEDE